MTTTTETVGVRLGKFLASQGISYGQFEKKTGWSNGLAGKVINKGVSFGVDKLERIFLAFPQLNPTWLITGGEYMIIQSSSQGKAQHNEKTPDDPTSPLSGTVDLKNMGLPKAEAAALVKDVTNTLTHIHLVASLERLLVLIESNSTLPELDKRAILRSLQELQNYLFLSVNQVIASEAKYQAAMDAIKLLAAQLQAEAEQNGQNK